MSQNVPPLPEERKFVIYPKLGCHGFFTYRALSTEPPACGEAAGTGSSDGGRNRFCTSLAPRFLAEPSPPPQIPQPLPEGLRHLQTASGA